jgi:hypothetical protein
VRVGTPLSGNFFSNKEAEASTKAANIRRLSLVLLAAEPNQYLTQLPHIQERLVDILRTPTGFPKISAEVSPGARGKNCSRLIALLRCISVFEYCYVDSPRST